MSTNDSFNFIRELAQRVSDREMDLVKMCCCYLEHEDRVEEVQKHFLYPDVKKHLKIKKDENAPKKAKSCYLLYSNFIRKEVTEANPTLKMHEISKKLAERWNALSEEEKKKWQVDADADKERYQKESDAYKKTLSEKNGSLNGVGSSNSSSN